MNTKQELRERIAKILKYYRDEAGRNQAETAQRLKVKMRTYQSWEEGRAQPPLYTLQKIVKLYDLDNMDELIGCKEVA